MVALKTKLQVDILKSMTSKAAKWMLAAVVLATAMPACGENQPKVPSWAHVSPKQRELAKELGIPVAFSNKYDMKFVLIPPGSFQMGSPENEEGRDSWEVLHDVTISKPFYLQATEVTNGQFRRWRPNHNAGRVQRWRRPEGKSATGEVDLNGDLQPALPLSHDDATQFAVWLSEQDERYDYRLPTEAEWEYACRAGAQSAFSFGGDRTVAPLYANFSDRNDPTGATEEQLDDGNEGTAPVGSYRPNAWGLFDMHGNVWEWTSSWYGEYPKGPVVDPTGQDTKDKDAPWHRGGSWRKQLDRMRCAMRRCYTFEAKLRQHGCRVVAVPKK